ncbi:cilia- and flagella-associated protein 52 isoform X2 [Denticeps clupeoides]|uniref:cilia- and flagella-associated protein 52 isoform X2 n=1 Tax=Denticeps clupeoides TaxID=299321 RepID=UPI0010A386D2|nr:cilia- and flagella-associated protein 52 isoform X2 [Denticeps clupeoides]
MMATDPEHVRNLELEAVIGFNGGVSSGLRVHPDRESLIYPLGCTVIVKNIKSGQQMFMHGHTNNVSCVTVSRTGHYIASGQADIIIWDYAKKEIYARLQLHKAKVEALVFSPNDKYLVSLGGQDDGSIIVWNVESREAICGSPASAHSTGHCYTIAYSNQSDSIFISAGCGNMRVWELDLSNRKIRPTDCQTGQLKRTVNCIAISEDDSFFFCGTTSGDILKVNPKTKLLNSCGPIKQKFSKGVSSIKVLKTGDILVGSGGGMFTLCSGVNFKTIKKVELEGGVTSIALRGEGHQFFVGTDAAQIYRFSYTDFEPDLISTNHNSAVQDVAFPFGSSELFATCSKGDIRVWYTDTSKELLRITVPNMTCNALDFMQDGRSIFSAWNDGKIRIFTPETGRLILIIHNAHSMGVTAIAGTRDCRRIISGGGEGQIRVWEILQRSYRLVETMKEHKASVNAIKIKSNDKECVTASSDGACIIWDLVRFVRNQMVLANTLFRGVCYHPEEFQIITCGTDRKIGYWEVYDGSAIIELEGSLSGAINGMHVSHDGNHFVTGGDEKLLKVWNYMKGTVSNIGTGHSGSITAIKICCNNKHIISTSADGAVLRWKFPHPPS